MALNPFDDLTLGEVEELTKLCLDGKPIGPETDSLRLAGAVMYMHQRRDDSALQWVDFKNRTKMVDIQAFASLISEENENPTNGATAITH